MGPIESVLAQTRRAYSVVVLSSPLLWDCAGREAGEALRSPSQRVYRGCAHVGATPRFRLASSSSNFSFFLLVLEAHAMHLVHLDPNTILMMAIFAHAFEMFVGVAPLTDLFHYFFALARTNPVSPAASVPLLRRTVGGSYFRIWSNHHAEFFSLGVQDNGRGSGSTSSRHHPPSAYRFRWDHPTCQH